MLMQKVDSIKSICDNQFRQRLRHAVDYLTNIIPDYSAAKRNMVENTTFRKL